MKIKIITDGTKTGIKIANADTDEIIENVIDVDWSADVKNATVYAIIKIKDPSIELIVPEN